MISLGDLLHVNNFVVNDLMLINLIVNLNNFVFTAT